MPRPRDRSPIFTVLLFILALAAVVPLGADGADAIIEVVADVPCAILVDDVVFGRADPAVVIKIPVESGFHDITALSLEIPEIEWTASIRVSVGDIEPLEIELADRVIDLIEDQVIGYQRESRLEDQDNGTLRDPESDLYWTLLDNNFDIDWDSSLRYCSTLMLDREDDERPWRLPTLNELKDIADEDFWDGYKILGQIRLSGCCVWSSEEHGHTSAWYFDYENAQRGFVTKDYPEGGRVLCVR